MKEKTYNIIIIADTIEDRLITQSLELVAFADRFTKGDLTRTLAVVPGKSVSELCVSISARYGIDSAPLEHAELYLPNPELLSHKVSSVIAEHKPELVLFTHTVRNCQCAAAISAKYKYSTLTAVEAFNHGSVGPVFRRSIFNGKLKENALLKTHTKILTVLPGAYTFSENRIASESNASVIQLERHEFPAPTEVVTQYDIKRYRPVSLSSESEGGAKLEDADVIVSVGRGIGKEENIGLIRETASIFENAAIGASRPVCDQRWLPFNRQVGITGKTVSPKLYLACGISGSQQHIAGMKSSQCVAAINKDPDAAIFSVADYIIIEDIITFLPLLVKKYREKYNK